MKLRAIVFVMGCATVALGTPRLAGVDASRGWAAQSRPPIVGVSHVAVQTGDLAKARGFYSGLLGYTEVAPAGRPHAAVFAVNERQRLIVHDGLPADRDERLLNVAFETTSVEALRAFQVARGTLVTEPVHDVEAGRRRGEGVAPRGRPVADVLPGPRTESE